MADTCTCQTNCASCGPKGTGCTCAQGKCNCKDCPNNPTHTQKSTCGCDHSKSADCACTRAGGQCTCEQ